jgi:hypothetical protein
MSSLQLPPQLEAALAQPPPAGLTPPEQGEAQDQEDPLDVLQECIQNLPKVISALPDPQDTQDAVQALHILTRIQTRMMRQSGSSQGQ